MTIEEAINYAEAINAKTQEKIEFYRRGNAHAPEVYYSDLAFLSAAISALREQEERRWIPVTERMPDKDGDYLVFKRFTRNAWSDVVSFAKDGRKVIECDFGEKWQNVWYYYDSEWGYIRTDAVTHWMPLPQPPKEV